MAYDPHEGEIGDTAAQAMREIDAGDMADALEIWEAATKGDESDA